jgi:hypothetical protein
MSAPTSPAGLPAGEPKDGDFVAYLAQIEQRQLAALKHGHALHASPHTSPHASQPASLTTSQGAAPDTADAPLTTAQAEAVRARLKQSAGDARQMLAAAAFALFGLFFIAQALLGEAGLVGLLIGGFLWWRAAVAARKLVGASPSSRDLATRLADTLRNAQSSPRK